MLRTVAVGVVEICSSAPIFKSERIEASIFNWFLMRRIVSGSNLSTQTLHCMQRSAANVIILFSIAEIPVYDLVSKENYFLFNFILIELNWTIEIVFSLFYDIYRGPMPLLILFCVQARSPQLSMSKHGTLKPKKQRTLCLICHKFSSFGRLHAKQHVVHSLSSFNYYLNIFHFILFLLISKWILSWFNVPSASNLYIWEQFMPLNVDMCSIVCVLKTVLDSKLFIMWTT